MFKILFITITFCVLSISLPENMFADVKLEHESFEESTPVSRVNPAAAAKLGVNSANSANKHSTHGHKTGVCDFSNNFHNAFNKKVHYYPTRLYYCTENSHFKIDQFYINVNQDMTKGEKFLEVCFQYTDKETNQKSEDVGYISQFSDCLKHKQEYYLGNISPRVKKYELKSI